MKRYLVRILVGSISLLFVNTVIGQTELGVGLVSIDFNDKTVVRFYKKPNWSRPAKTIEFFDDKSIKSWNIRDLDSHRAWLQPEVLWLDYSSFVFRCKSKTPGWFEVIVNNKTGRTYWLRNEKQIGFQTWGTFLKEMFNVERDGENKQLIYSFPNATSRPIKYKGRDCFTVRSMRGDWIEITTSDYCHLYTESKTKIKSGWIKWRKGNKLLIEYFITS